MADWKHVVVLAALVVGTVGVRASTEPPDPCSLLSAADLNQALGGNVGAPTKSVAPRPFANTVEGTDCHYDTGHKGLLFRIYFDPSPGAATDLFARLKMFYSPPRPVPGLGDEAYFDKNHGLHVRKGNVRYFLQGSATEVQLTALGQRVAGQL